jgi:hypothetical protein
MRAEAQDFSGLRSPYGYLTNQQYARTAPQLERAENAS